MWLSLMVINASGYCCGLNPQYMGGQYGLKLDRERERVKLVWVESIVLFEFFKFWNFSLFWSGINHMMSHIMSHTQ